MFKDTAAFKKKEGVCYIPESGKDKYTYQDFLDISMGNEKLAAVLFSLVNWQSPESVFDELLREGDIDENGNILV